MKQPRFRWVHSPLDLIWRLREVGGSFAYATIHFLRKASLGDRGARKAGFQYTVHLTGQGLVSYCRELQDAKAAGRELAAHDMATKNSVAWAAAAPARRAERERQDRERQEQQRAAAEVEGHRRAVLYDALGQYVENLRDAIDVAEPGDPEQPGREDRFLLAQLMLDEMDDERAAAAEISGAAFVAAAQASIEPRTDSELAAIVDAVEGDES